MSGYAVRNLGTILPTSSGATNSNIFLNLDDAESIGIFITSSANVATSGIYVTDEDSTSPSEFYRFSSTGGAAMVTSSGSAHVISPVTFRGLRLSNLASGTAAEIIGVVTKKIFV